jgi:hypothetical protein
MATATQLKHDTKPKPNIFLSFAEFRLHDAIPKCNDLVVRIFLRDTQTGRMNRMAAKAVSRLFMEMVLDIASKSLPLKISS